MGLTVPPYTGQDQQSRIDTPLTVAPEDGPRRVANYEFPPPEEESVFLPPPLYKTELWSAQQTWPQ